MDTLARVERRLAGGLERLFRSRVLGAAALGTTLASLVLVFGVASDEMYGVSHGINLIAYWHIGIAMAAALALTVTFAGSVVYLSTGREFWERIAFGSGELGFLFVTLTLVTGSVWARVIWNTWWEWSDVRLVTFLIIWFIYAGYLIVRTGGSDTQRLRRLASVYAIVGFVTVPISYVSTRLWTARFHAPSMGNPDADATITTSALLVSMLAMVALYVYLLGSRVRVATLADRVEAARTRRGSETYNPADASD